MRKFAGNHAVGIAYTAQRKNAKSDHSGIWLTSKHRRTVKRKSPHTNELSHIDPEINGQMIGAAGQWIVPQGELGIVAPTGAGLSGSICTA